MGMKPREMSRELWEGLRDICARHGIDEIASCRVEELTHKETVIRIHEILPNAVTIVVALKRIPDDGMTSAHAAPYQEAVLQVFDDLCAACEEMVRFLCQCGLPALWPGKERTPYQKQIAVAAGLGSIGDSNLLISSRYGAAVHLETLLVAVPLSLPKSDNVLFECDGCGLCFTACPVEAIQRGGVDRGRCSTYRRSKVVPHKGKTYCGLCMKVCPQNGSKKT